MQTAALCLAAAGGLRGQALRLEGQRVAEVRILDDKGQPLTLKISKLPLEAGQAYRTEAERESVRQLYNTGDFSDIRVDAEEVEGGVRVDFLARRNHYNNVVRMEGLREPPSEAQALSALRMNLGEPFRGSALREGLARLERLLQEQGFYQAKVERQLTPHEDTRQMDITVRVAPGPRATVGAITVHNQSEFSTEEITEHSKLKPGKPITAARLDRGEEHMRNFLTKANHLGARVVIRRGEYDAKTDTVPLTFDITAGPKVRVELNGAKFRSSQLHTILPIYAEGTVDEDLLQEGRRKLRDALEKQGYFDATVQYTTRDDTEHGTQVITYTVDRGKQHRVAGVAFDGNKYFSDDLLESRLSIQAKSFASLGRYSDELLHADEDSLRGLYVANGFRAVAVRSEVDDNYRGKTGVIFVKFHITEGPQTRVAALKLEGNRALTTEDLLAVTGSTPGQPYSEANVTSDRDNILALYFNEGFPGAQFEPRVEDTGIPNRVRITYQITEGTQVIVDRVLLTGYKYTREGIIARQVQVQPGGPLRESDVVETQRRLFNLGVFNRVVVAPQNPDGTDSNKTVVVETDEAKRYTVSYGFGFEAQRLGGSGTSPTGGSLSASPRGVFEVSRANFLGRGQTVSLKLRGSTFQYRGLLSLAAPNFLANPKLSLLLTGFADKTRDVRTFTATKYEGSVQLSQALTQFTTLQYRYTFRHVLVDQSSLKIPAEQIPLLSQPTRVSGPGLTLIREHRDNPADASRGNFNSVDVTVAARAVGSSASFTRIFLQNSSFHPFGRSFVFARSFRFGVEQTMGSTTDIQIPLPERFFAGGGTSLRGFSLNQAGPRDSTTGFPIGGLALLIFNQELRFPMRLPYVGNRVGGALFYDAGNVYSDVNHITFRSEPTAADVKNGNLNYLSHTIGMGFRYATPIGPVRFDLGYQLNPAVFQFNNAAGMPTTARLSRFQFFFNIGSIF